MDGPAAAAAGLGRSAAAVGSRRRRRGRAGATPAGRAAAGSATRRVRATTAAAAGRDWASGRVRRRRRPPPPPPRGSGATTTTRAAAAAAAPARRPNCRRSGPDWTASACCTASCRAPTPSSWSSLHLVDKKETLGQFSHWSMPFAAAGRSESRSFTINSGTYLIVNYRKNKCTACTSFSTHKHKITWK